MSREEAEKLYQDGEAFFRAGNYSRAVVHYQKTADAGHTDAQYSLGIMYKYGRGVSKDLQKAREWYSKAAAQRH